MKLYNTGATDPNGCAVYDCHMCPHYDMFVNCAPGHESWTTDRYGSDIYKCDMVCPEYDCMGGFTRHDLGKDEHGCDIIDCKAPCMQQMCAPGYDTVDLGNDENGCPQIECVPICPVSFPACDNYEE